MNDISNIKATLRSNHTLLKIFCINTMIDPDKIQGQIDNATCINVEYSPGEVGREKLIQLQLDSKIRARLAGLQGVSHSFYSEINPLHLPEVLSIVGRRHGRKELYVALKSSIAGVISTVNRKACILKKRDYYLAKVELLNAELAAIEAAEVDAVHVGSKSRSSKRRRA